MIKVRVQDADQVKVGVGSDVVQVMNNNYNELENKPQINSVTLQGNKDGNDLGLANLDDIPSLEGYATEEWVESQGYLTEHQSLANYYTKGQTDDLLDAKADETDLVEHTSNTTIHVTSGDKSAWNAKYDKPNGGIPKNDLSASVQSSLGKADTAIQEHQSLANYSTTAQMNQAINAHHDATKQDVLTSQTAYTQKGTATKVPQITTNSLGQVTAISEVNIDKTTLSDLGITATASEINVLDGITASTAELNYTDGVTSNIQTQLNNKEDADATILKQADVVNNTSSTVTNKPLSANMGKALQDSINNLKSIGRFLAIWNASTGRPTSEPTVSPYVYKTGDYYRIGTVGNKIPTGSQYVIDGTNWTTTTDTLAVGDVYYYDGTSWVRQASSGGGTVQDVQVEGTSVLTGGVANVQLSDFGINATASELNYMDGVTSNVQTQLNAKYDASNPSGFVTSSYHDATKQDVIDSAHKLDYSLLSNTPTIPVVPTNVSAFTNDAGYLTEHQSLANYYTKSETDSEISGHHDSTKQNVIDSAHKLDYSLIDNQPTIPSKTSQLTNDSGFLTEHQSLADYSTTTQMNTAIANHHDSTKYDASNPQGYTSNTGTVTSVGVKMNGATKGTVTTSGTIDLGTVLTSHQDISGKEDTSNKVTSISSSSTDTQYPSAKLLYDQLEDKEDADATILKQANVVDNTTSTSAIYPLSAHIGKELQDQVNNLKNIGRFLAIWDCSTGLPLTDPVDMPYTYKTGDYYRVGAISTATPSVNYKPTGSTYNHIASTVTETEDVEVGWVYYYDGSSWKAQSAGGGGTVQDVQVNSTSVVSSGTGIADIGLDDFGITSTVTELNYTDGVTSNIQTQLNNKIEAEAIQTIVATDINDADLLDGKDRAYYESFRTPIGTILSFGGSTIPSGWLECDGSAVNRSVYTELFSIIGTTYGAGDGSTTFNLPKYEYEEQKKLLWTNPSPTSSYTGTTVSMDLSGYDDFIVIFKTSPSVNDYHTFRCIKGMNDCYIAIPNDASETPTWAMGRRILFSNSSFTISTNAGWYTYGGSSSTGTSWYIPYKIYGIQRASGTTTRHIIKANNNNFVEPSSATIEQRIGAVESQVSRIENYSTDEQVIGTWIDGKPIYRKVVTTSSPSSVAEAQIYIDSSVQQYTKVDGYELVNSNEYLPLNMYIDTHYNCTIAKGNRITMRSDWANRPVILILEYTKTTD